MVATAPFSLSPLAVCMRSDSRNFFGCCFLRLINIMHKSTHTTPRAQRTIPTRTAGIMIFSLCRLAVEESCTPITIRDLRPPSYRAIAGGSCGNSRHNCYSGFMLRLNFKFCHGESVGWLVQVSLMLFAFTPSTSLSSTRSL